MNDSIYHALKFSFLISSGAPRRMHLGMKNSQAHTPFHIGGRLLVSEKLGIQNPRLLLGVVGYKSVYKAIIKKNTENV